MSPDQSILNTQPNRASTQFYEWRGHQCVYEMLTSPNAGGDRTPLLLIHPIGVGLSRRFWDRFSTHWLESGQSNPIYSPDLLGCGESDMPHVAYHPEDWAEQLRYFSQTVIQQPAILLVQGALFPVAIALSQLPHADQVIRGLILAGPPAWSVMTRQPPTWQQRVSWNLFDSPLGRGFYRYARRRKFLKSFSENQLFDTADDVDDHWLDMLIEGADDPASRHAVFSFLAGFWRRDYGQAIAQIDYPTLVVIGNTASSISQSGKSETPDQRMADYLERLPKGDGVHIQGRNVLPYESTDEFITAIAPFVNQLSSKEFAC